MKNKYIAIIDYNAGNIKSVENAFKREGAIVKVTNDKNTIRNSAAIVLPGVGAFGDAMKNLIFFNLADLLKKEIKIKPFLGICLGLQLLFEYSNEIKQNEGLGILKGYVDKIPDGVKIPHIGWNQINILKKDSIILKDVENNDNFYFDHSFYAISKDKSIISSTTNYGTDLTASIEVNNIFALQFHPEKSSLKGLNIIKNFINYVNKN
jgi:glutamine amidotransferase